MVQHEPKACQFCGDRFVPHPNVGARQIACPRPECQRARKRENLQKLYRSDPGYNYDNVKRYRARHPDYQRQWRQRRKQKIRAQDRVGQTAVVAGKQAIPASLFVSPQKSEIQTELSAMKTNMPAHKARPIREIQTELTLYFSVPLSNLTDFLPDARYKPS